MLLFSNGGHGIEGTVASAYVAVEVAVPLP